MPELPEVETTRRGIEPHVRGRVIAAVVVREPRLRWPIDPELTTEARGQPILSVQRRAKYLLLGTPKGTLILHLGMSGSLRLVDAELAPGHHDHVDLLLDNGTALRFRDPRRFGSWHWSDQPLQHPLLQNLGPEPWDAIVTGAYLHGKARGRRQAVKNFLMDSHIVVGVGNIYASEVLFATGIRPTRAAGQVSAARYARVVTAIQEVLTRAIAHGGTTLRDFVNGAGKPGYFRHELQVYDRAGEPCKQCGSAIRQSRIGQRSSYFCGRCQS